MTVKRGKWLGARRGIVVDRKQIEQTPHGLMSGDPINNPKSLVGKCKTDVVSRTRTVSVFLLSCRQQGPLYMVTMQKRDDYDLWTMFPG
jgi:hypothetical protein